MEMDWTQIPCFANLSSIAIRKIQRQARRRAYPAGAMIFREDEACAGFKIVAKGLVRIYRISAEGRLHTLSLLRPVAAFNEVAAVDGGKNPCNATAVTQSVILTLSHERLMNLLATEPTLLGDYVQSLAHVNREYIERLEDMTFRTIPSRLAKLFLHETTYAEHIAEAPPRMTPEEIASILGTTREVVGRALRGLLNAGLLRKEGRKVYIADRMGLEILAATNMMPERAPLACRER